MINYLKKYRESVKLTQAKLAESVGCARETIANLESGKYNPSLAMAYSILNCINSQSGLVYEYEITDIFPNENAACNNLQSGLVYEYEITDISSNEVVS